MTEGTVTVNLIMEGPEGDEMHRRPIPANEALITRPMLTRLVLMDSTSVIAVFGFFAWRCSSGDPFTLVQTETFTLMVVTQWFNVLNCRIASRSVLSLKSFKNRWLMGGAAAG